jgi:O-antigen ligase
MNDFSRTNSQNLTLWDRWQAGADKAARGTLIFTAFVTPISTAAMNAGLAFLLLFFLFSGHFRERISEVLKHPVVWATFALLGLLCLGALWTVGPLDEAGWQISKYSKLLFIPLVLILAANDRTRNAVITAVLAALLLTAALSFVNEVSSLPAWLSRATREGVFDGNNYIFKHHIIQNVFLSVAVLLCTAVAVTAQSAQRRALFVVFAFVCAASIIFMAQGRTGYLTLAAVVGVAAWTWIRTYPRMRWAVLSVVIAASVIAAASPAVQQRVAQTVTDYQAHKTHGTANAVAHRLVFWRTSLDIMREHPWLGAGTGAYRQEFLKRVNDPAFTGYGAYNPHNQFLYFGTQLGLAGVACYLIFLWALWRTARGLPDARRMVAYGVVLIIAIYSMFDSPLFITEGHFFVILIGVIWVLRSGAGATQASTEPVTLLA